MMEPPFPSASHTTGVSYGNSRGGLPSGVPINSKASSFPRHLYDIFFLLVAENRQSPTLRWTTSGWWDQPVNHHWFPCGLPSGRTWQWKHTILQKVFGWKNSIGIEGFPESQVCQVPKPHHFHEPIKQRLQPCGPCAETTTSTADIKLSDVHKSRDELRLVSVRWERLSCAQMTWK